MKKLTFIVTLLLCCYTNNATGRAIDYLQTESKAWEPLARAVEYENESVSESTSLLSLTLPSIKTPRKSAQLQPRDPVTRSTEWQGYKKKGTENMSFLRYLQGKSEQNPIPDDIPKDLPALTENNFACSNWEVQYGNYEEPNEVDNACLDLLKLSAKSERGCRQIQHRDSSYDSWHDDHHPGIFYENKFCPTNGGFVAQRNYKTMKDSSGKVHTTEVSWADAVYSAWFTECKATGVPVGYLQWVRRESIENPITLRLIAEMQKAHQPVERGTDDLKLKVYTLTLEDDDFFALFASPNGNGVFYFLRDHMQALKKYPRKIYVIYVWEEEYYDVWGRPNMILRF